MSGPAVHGSALVDPAARLSDGVRIGPWTLIGPDVEIGAGTEVEAHAVIGGMAKATQDVLPFVLADGWPAGAHAVNVIGMRRAGIDPASRRQVQEAFRILYRSGLSPGAAVERLRDASAEDAREKRVW